MGSGRQGDFEVTETARRRQDYADHSMTYLDTPELGGATRGRPQDRIFYLALVFSLAGYLIFDRGFAWLHVPGTPVFIGEILLVLGLFYVATRPLPRQALRRSTPLAALAAYVIWGALLSISGLLDNLLDALRDSALWYYALLAFIVFIALETTPGLLRRLLDLYERLIPFMVTLFLALVPLSDFPAAPTVPDSSVSILSNNHGSIAAKAASAFVFIWVARPTHRTRRPRLHIYITLVALASILLAGTQARSGLVAALLGLLVGVLLAPGGRRRMLVAMGLAVATLGIAGSLFASAPEFADRAVSTQQIADNLESIVNPEAATSQLANTAEWRETFWRQVISDVVTTEPLSGYGFGTNIREIYGYQKENPPSRNTHNSHVTILARMGAPGAFLWVTVWVVWFASLLKARRHHLLIGNTRVAGTLSWLVVVATAMHVNGIFTGTLEAPQGAMILWVVFGIGAYLSRRGARIGDDDLAPIAAT